MGYSPEFAQRRLFLRSAAVLCLLAIGVFFCAQAAHVHSDASSVSQEHCSLCVVAHTAGVSVPVAGAVTLPHVSLTLWHHTFEIQALHSQILTSNLFTRPPPLG